MTAAADHQTRGCTEPLGKNTKRPKCLHSAGSHLLQRRQLCFQTLRRMFRPDGHTAAQQQLRPLRRALQHRSQ